MKILLSVLALQSFLVSLAFANGASTFVSYAQLNDTLDTIQTQLAYANGSVYFGDIKYSTYSEALILTYPGGAPGKVGGMSWTSFHSAETGWQNFYIYPNDTKPIGFTIPHSAAIPLGAEPYNFTVSTTDNLLRYKHFNRWFACNATTPARTYQIYYVGEGRKPPVGCIKTNISAYGYGDCPWGRE